MSRTCAATAILVALAQLLVLSAVPTAAAAARAPEFPDLLPAGHPDAAAWTAIGKVMWTFLIDNDFDFVNATGHVVPEAMAGSSISGNQTCGRIARLWVRMPFHDCGTFSSITRKGGCNGSLRKELPAPEPFVDPKTGKVLFADCFDGLGKNKSRADFGYDPTRKENSGFAVSVMFFYSMVFAAEDFGLKKASWADMMIYGGMLSLAMCRGPRVLFVPGRVDSPTADARGMLPAATDNITTVLSSYGRAGLGTLDAVLAQSSHTIACFRAGCLDSTPNKFDNRWAVELLNFHPASGFAEPICTLPGSFPAQAQARCFAPMDLEFLKRRDTLLSLELIASSTHGRRSLTDAAAAAAGASGGGLLWKVNLCTRRTCDWAQWAYFQLYASTYYRLCSLGITDKLWVGFAPAVTGGQVQLQLGPALQAAAVAAAAAGEAAVPAREPSEEERTATCAAWAGTYRD